jgi:hypothetical protein
MRTCFAPPTHGHSDHDRLDGTAISLAQVLSVVDAVGDQFRHAAPSKASATLVQSALWLVVAKLEALHTPPRPSPCPPANREPSAARPFAHAAAVGEPMAPTHPPAGDARDGADAAPSNTENSRHAASTPETAPAPLVSTLSGHRAQPAPPKSTADFEPPAPVPEGAHAHAVAPVSSSMRVGIADQARPTASTTVIGRVPAAAEKAAAPPDEYDGLCAVGARLFAAAAVTA